MFAQVTEGTYLPSAMVYVNLADYSAAFLGGLLIAAGASLQLYTFGRVTGFSGILFDVPLAFFLLAQMGRGCGSGWEGNPNLGRSVLSCADAELWN